MFWNLYRNYPSYGKFINIGSGVELGYIPNSIEQQLSLQLPVLPYALSKNLIAREVIKNFHFYNLRLFGLIAHTRVFDKLHQAVDQNESTFSVTDDKYMDYLREEDLCKIIRYYVEQHSSLVKDINMVYEKKMLVSDVLKRYVSEKNLSIEINVLNTVEGQDYTGSGYKLSKMNIL
jgi:hypothetical protein